MKAKKIIFYCLAGLMAGCGSIASLNPLFTKEDLVFDEKLLGTWLPAGNNPAMSWEFARFEESAAQNLPPDLQGEFKRIYRLNQFDKDVRKGVLVACLVRLGDRRFLDIFPDQFPSGECNPEEMKLTLNAEFFLPVHWFLRVDAIGDQLRIRAPDFDEFKKLMEAEPKAVAYGTSNKGIILTASTRDLQAFVAKYADDPRLFAIEGTLVRKNK